MEQRQLHDCEPSEIFGVSYGCLNFPSLERVAFPNQTPERAGDEAAWLEAQARQPIYTDKTICCTGLCCFLRIIGAVGGFRRCFFSSCRIPGELGDDSSLAAQFSEGRHTSGY